MHKSVTAVGDYFDNNFWWGKLYTVIFLLIIGGASAHALVNDKYWIVAILAAIIIVPLAISHPTVAVFQFVFVIFIQYRITEAVPLYLTDISAAVLILAAIFDILSEDKLPRRFPTMTLNYLLLLIALFVCALASYNPIEAVHPLSRISLYLFTFLALIRLLGKVDGWLVVRMYLWLCVAHSVVVLAPFIASGGSARAFGFSRNVFGSLAMVALPVGLCSYLWSRPGKSAKYLFGTILILGAMVATQSRFILIFGLFISMVAVFISLRRVRNSFPADKSATEVDSEAKQQFKKRLIFLGGTVLSSALMAMIINPEVLGPVIGRFEQIFSATGGGTMNLRLSLWMAAITVFLENPLTGIGPGNFRNLFEINSSYHLNPVFYYIKGLSAHNLFLHYLAETGLVGASAMIAFFVRPLLLSRKIWHSGLSALPVAFRLSLYSVSILIVLSTFLEAGWLWGQVGFAAVLFIALIVDAFEGLPSNPASDPTGTSTSEM